MCNYAVWIDYVEQVAATPVLRQRGGVDVCVASPLDLNSHTHKLRMKGRFRRQIHRCTSGTLNEVDILVKPIRLRAEQEKTALQTLFFSLTKIWKFFLNLLCYKWESESIIFTLRYFTPCQELHMVREVWSHRWIQREIFTWIHTEIHLLRSRSVHFCLTDSANKWCELRQQSLVIWTFFYAVFSSTFTDTDSWKSWRLALCLKYILVLFGKKLYAKSVFPKASWAESRRQQAWTIPN